MPTVFQNVPARFGVTYGSRTRVGGASQAPGLTAVPNVTPKRACYSRPLAGSGKVFSTELRVALAWRTETCQPPASSAWHSNLSPDFASAASSALTTLNIFFEVVLRFKEDLLSPSFVLHRSNVLCY